jgi:hypothetical protein
VRTPLEKKFRSALVHAASEATDHWSHEDSVGSEFVLPVGSLVSRLPQADFYVSYELNAFTTHPQNMQFIYSELHRNIQDRFNEGGIEINFPHYASIRGGNRRAIPTNISQKIIRNRASILVKTKSQLSPGNRHRTPSLSPKAFTRILSNPGLGACRQYDTQDS